MYRVTVMSLFAVGFSIVTFVACNNGDKIPPDTTDYGVNHTCTILSHIPGPWLDSAQANVKLHYAHTSHGEQLMVGIERLESANPDYSYALEHGALPTENGALCIFDGQEHETYVTPDLYWQSTDGMNYTRAVLDHNPAITASMWAWCTQLDYFSEAEVKEYLDSMSTLEAEYPNVHFVYMTGTAQASGAEGYNRFLRNEQIRTYCKTHGKFLFDFEDLDAWWFNPATDSWEPSSYNYNGTAVPLEHSRFHGDEAAHTTNESCEQKGRAFWWLAALLAGWPGN